MNNALLKAVSSVLEKKIEGDIPEGLYSFDHVLTIRVKGSANQAGSQEFTPTAEIPLLGVLARVLQSTGWAGDRVAEVLTRCTNEAIANNAPVGDYLEYTNEALRRVRETITSNLTPKRRKGPFTKTIELEVMSIEANSTQSP